MKHSRKTSLNIIAGVALMITIVTALLIAWVFHEYGMYLLTEESAEMDFWDFLWKDTWRWLS